jgi:cytochrome c oxidase assembly protein Cox11
MSVVPILGLVSSCYHVAVDTRASGTVIDVSGSGEGETVRVRFIAQSGEPTEFTAHVESQYVIGETATVLYSPENPTKARIYSFYRLWFTPLVALPVGLIFSLSGILEIRDRLRGIYE